MNAGFSSLTVLKQHLLPGTWADVTSEDAAITALGLGVAELFEGHCGRTFQRAVDAVEKHDTGAGYLQLRRFPVEEVSELELQGSFNGAWEDVLSSVARVDEKSGVMTLVCPFLVGGSLKVTLTGGFWWDTTEDASGTLPATATALPPVIHYAWLMQCAALYARMQTDAVKAGLASGNLGALSSLINEATLLPIVRSMLEPLRVMAV